MNELQALITPAGLARLIVRSCQALSAADLALGSADGSPEVAGADGAGGAAGAGGGGGASGILSGGAEGDMTAALRKLHELGPSLAGRCVCAQLAPCVPCARFACEARTNRPDGRQNLRVIRMYEKSRVCVGVGV